MGLTKERLENINGDDRLAELEKVRGQREQEREQMDAARKAKLGQRALEEPRLSKDESQAITSEVASLEQPDEDAEVSA